MRAAMLSSRAAAPWQMAHCPTAQAMPPTPPHQPPCTLRFASLFESDDEGDDAPREACGPQTPKLRGVGSSAVSVPGRMCSLRSAGPPPALPSLTRSGLLGASAAPGGASLTELACVKRVSQLSAPLSLSEKLIAKISLDAVACSGATSSSSLAVHVAAALRSGGYSAQAAGATHDAFKRGDGKSPPACAQTRALLDRAGRHAFVTVMEASGGGTLIVEPRLREQFEIPRPSAAYAASLNVLPAVFVGSAQRLAFLVAWMAARLRAAFDAEGMHVPPWRSARTMLAMWRLDTHAGAAAAKAAESDVALLLAGGRAAPRMAVVEAMHMQRNGAPYPVRVSACSPPATPPAWRGRLGAA